MISRRQFLRSGILTGALTFAGCQRPVPEVKTQPPDPGPGTPPPDRAVSTEVGRIVPLDRQEYAERLAMAQRLLTQAKIGSLFLTPSTNFYYLTGKRFARSERLIALLVPRRGESIMVCPSFEAGRLRQGLPEFSIKTWDEHEDPYRQVQAALRQLKASGQPIAIEPTTEYDTFRHLRQAMPGAAWVDGSPLLDAMRMVKSARELEFMRRAVEGTVRAIDRVFITLTPGLTEQQVAQDMRAEMRRQGGEGGGLVQFGPNSAVPHGGPSDRKLAPGDVVLFDVGMRVEGYTSDITRTGLYKDRPAEVEKIYDLVLRAQRAGQAAAKPGVLCETVDAAARAVIAEAGYGPFFTHRLGHGLGLEGHEKPYLVRGNKTVLQPGMTVTIEPGIYLPEKFGVRIEDDFVITEDGCRSLSPLESSLRVI